MSSVTPGSATAGSATTSVPNALATSSDCGVLGPAILVAGESSEAYDNLLARIRAVVEPTDMLEEIWVRDVTDLAWEVSRLRRIKAHLMQACAHEGLAKALSHLRTGNNHYIVAKHWFAGDPEAARIVNTAFAAAGLTVDTVTALTMSERINEIERIELMTMAAERRRDGMLRELERRRESLAAKLQRALPVLEAASDPQA
jgi:hypothetical protein